MERFPDSRPEAGNDGYTAVSIAHIPFGQLRIPFYRSIAAVNEKDAIVFYHGPLLILQPHSLTSRHNPFTRKHAINFTVTISNSAFRQHAKTAQSNLFKISSCDSDVRSMLIEQIQVTAIEESPVYQVDSSWQSLQPDSDAVTFRMSCADQLAGDELMRNIMAYPAMFLENFVVRYRVATQQISRNTCELTGKIHIFNEEETPAATLDQAITETQNSNAVKIRNEYLDEIVCHATKSRINGMEIYRPKLEQLFIDSEDKLRFVRFGKSAPQETPPKVILVLGASGAGKSTLVDCIFNHVLGVQWDDDMRLKVTITEDSVRYTTAYQTVVQYGSAAPYNLILVDAPGFGDPRGVGQDAALRIQLQQLFVGDYDGVKHVDGICIVVEGNQSLTAATDTYIMDCILSMFGRNVESNIFLFSTHTHNQEPPAAVSFKKNYLPLCESFGFNNGALYSKEEETSEKSGELYWKMGATSTKQLIQAIQKLGPASMEETLAVLDDRLALEAAVDGLKDAIDAKMEKLGIPALLETMDACSKRMEENACFTKEVEMPYTKRVTLPNGQFSMHCISCNKECFRTSDPYHNRGSYCKRCPPLCPWDKHVSSPYYMEKGTKKVPQLQPEVKRRYEAALAEKEQIKNTIDSTLKAADLDVAGGEINRSILQCSAILQRLKETTIRAGILDSGEYVEALIQSEKVEKCSGYLRRTEALMEIKPRAILTEICRNVVRHGEQAMKLDTPTWIRIIAAERQGLEEYFPYDEERKEEERKAERQRREEEIQEQRERTRGLLERLQRKHKEEQQEIQEKMKNEQREYQEKLNSYSQRISEAKKRMQEIQDQMEKPIKDREQKLAFVNGLGLPIRETDNVLLLGPKGMGKSTFLWLLNKGEKPTRTMHDGTKDLVQVPGFTDSIGLRAWTPEELLKLLTLLIYDGIPRDLIIFSNERIDLPVTSLGLVGINNPMFVVMSSAFWSNYGLRADNPRKINLIQDERGVRRIQPEENLGAAYNMEIYRIIREEGLGTPLTHHDNLEDMVQRRHSNGVQPFQYFIDKLRDQFTVEMENDSTMEALFRFVYLYEKVYEKDRLKFMNMATLEEFPV
ncbi:uncharacterized protein LOC129588710 [Paramacrobiotus metropolitanus]|uniref:uncharacterized protein LOC129588710 n=1 Tax=Paramacrobiotus metropolitanus TaxID=2943436 RepID=UPI00244592EB|nr:uncharacterized protein LOC129588710 [Paramacrobiotus metropolitanus]